MTMRELNERKKVLKCLGCGKPMRTDRCHRFCQPCKKKYYSSRTTETGRLMASQPVKLDPRRRERLWFEVALDEP